MEVHIKITKEELGRYKEYAHIRRMIADLCNNKCGSPGSRCRMECYGCPDRGKLEELLDKTGIKDYDESGVIKEYVETLFAFCDARVAFDRANDRLNNLRRKCDDAYSKFEVIP